MAAGFSLSAPAARRGRRPGPRGSRVWLYRWGGVGFLGRSFVYGFAFLLYCLAGGSVGYGVLGVCFAYLFLGYANVYREFVDYRVRANLGRPYLHGDGRGVDDGRRSRGGVGAGADRPERGDDDDAGAGQAVLAPFGFVGGPGYASLLDDEGAGS